MKNMKRWFCLFLTLLILVSMPASAFAGGPSIKPNWASGGTEVTHQNLTDQVLTILYNDNHISAYNLLLPYKATLMTYSDWPDKYENDFGLFTSHFYNPYTGKTFLGKTTALTRFTTHANYAKTYYATNKAKSMQELGKALHYLADINEPHHAALMIAVVTNHSAYESWVDLNEEPYLITKSEMAPEFVDVTTDARKAYTTYYTSLFKNAAYNAYDMKEEASSSEKAQWAVSANDTLKYAQASMAAFLYNFLYAVGAVNKS